MFKTTGILSYWRPAMWGTAAVLLCLPAIVMSFFPDAGVNWTGSDFVVMGVMLTLACVAVEIGARMADNLPYLAGLVFAVGTGFVTVWVNLAVGMILSEDNPENLVFLGVLALAIVGSLAVRLRARGMVKVMLCTGALQALIGITVFASGLDEPYTASLITAFALPWWLSAGLFHWSASTGGSLAHAS